VAIPDTWQGLADAGYVFDCEGCCSGKDCRAKIEFWITPQNRTMPMTVVEVKKDSSAFSPVIGYKRIPHWSDCPNADDFRRKR